MLNAQFCENQSVLHHYIYIGPAITSHENATNLPTLCFRDNLDAFRETLCPVICTSSLDCCLLFKLTFLYLSYILCFILALFTHKLYTRFFFCIYNSTWNVYLFPNDPIDQHKFGISFVHVSLIKASLEIYFTS